MSVDLDWEKDLLAGLLDRDKRLLQAALPVLRRYDFSLPEHAWIWLIMATTWENCREFPTSRRFIEASKEIPDAAKRKSFLVTLKSLADRVPEGPVQALDIIRRYVRTAAGRTAIMDGYEALNKGDIDGAESALDAGIARMRQAAALEEAASLEDTFDDRLRIYRGENPEERKVRIPTPLETLNRWTAGGPWPGCLCFVVAPSGVGKSAMMIDTAYHALSRSNAVVVDITTEDPLDVRSAKYDARFSGVPVDRLTSGEALSDLDQAKLIRGFRLAKSFGVPQRLYIHELPPGSPVGAVISAAAAAREKHPDQPLVVIIDLMDDLAPNGKASDHPYINVRDVARAITAMALDERGLNKCVVWAATQATRDVKRDKGVRNPDKVGEGHDKFKKSSLFLSLYEASGDPKDPEDEETDAFVGEEPVPMEIKMLKSRLGRTQKGSVMIMADLGCCRFWEMGDEDFS